jgi:hypothetical protein
VVRLLAALAFAAMSMAAADVSGTWLGSATTGRRNLVTDFGFRFVQKDGAITGKAYLDYGTVPILNGTIEGDKISFEIVAREQNGNEVSETVFRFSGVIKEGEIELKRERQGMRNVVNAGTGFARQGAEVIFKIKRLP